MCINNRRKTLQEFEKYEKENDLDKEKVFGVLWWDLFRYELSNALFKKGKGNVIKVKKKEQIKRFFYSISDLFDLRLFRKRDILIFGHPLKRNIKGKAIDIYVDPLLTCLGQYNVGVIEHRLDGDFRYFPNIIKLGGLQMIASSLGLLISYVLFSKKVSQIICKFNRYFNSPFLNKRKFIKAIVKFKIEVFLYKNILRLIWPEKILIVASCGKESFIYAAKIMGIKTIELQHGTPARGKMNYDYSSGVSKQYFPDAFFSFGSALDSNIQLPLNERMIFEVGYAYLTLQKKILGAQKKEYDVLFLSQPDIDIHLMKFIEQAIFKNEKKIIAIRLHPTYSNNAPSFYSSLVRKGLKIINNDNETLYESILRSSVVVGGYSTALLESVFFCAKSFFIPDLSASYADFLQKNGVMALECMDELLKCKAIDREKHRPFVDFDKKYFLHALNCV